MINLFDSTCRSKSTDIFLFYKNQVMISLYKKVLMSSRKRSYGRHFSMALCMKGYLTPLSSNLFNLKKVKHLSRVTTLQKGCQ